MSPFWEGFCETLVSTAWYTVPVCLAIIIASVFNLIRYNYGW